MRGASLNLYIRDAESWWHWSDSDSDSDSRLLIDSDSGSDSDSDSGSHTKYKLNNTLIVEQVSAVETKKKLLVKFRSFRSVRAIAGPGGVIGPLPRPKQRWANHREKY